MIIECHVKPGSKKRSVALEGNILKLSLVSPPEGNQANLEVLKVLNNIFGGAEIVRGLKSRKKLIKLPAKDIFEIKTRLDES